MELRKLAGAREIKRLSIVVGAGLDNIETG